MPQAEIRVDAGRLNAFATAVYAGAGMPEADARLLADTLVQSDLWGHQSHGVLRLGWYLERLQNKVMDPVTKPEFVVDAGAMAVIAETQMAYSAPTPVPLISYLVPSSFSERVVLRTRFVPKLCWTGVAC